MVPRAKDPDDLPAMGLLGKRQGKASNAASGDKAFAFLSKTVVEAQRGAEIDLKFLSARAKELRDMVPTAPNLDEWEKIRIPLPSLSSGPHGKEVTAGELFKQFKEKSRKALASSPGPLGLEDWDKIKIPLSPGKDVTAGELVRQLQENGRKALASTPKHLSFEELQVVKDLHHRLPPALTEFQKRFPESLPALGRPGVSPPGKKLPLGREAWTPLDAPLPFPFLPLSSEGSVQQASQKSWDEREDIEEVMAQKLRAVGQQWQQHFRAGGQAPLLRPFEGRPFISFADWNKSVKEQKWKLPLPAEKAWEPLKRVTDGLKDLSEQHKQQPALPQGDDVSFLGVPEVLEVLSRTSEEVLSTLGARSDVSRGVGSAVRQLKVVSQRLSGPVEDTGADALDQRLAAVMDSTGYRHKDDGVNDIGRMVQRCQLALAGKRAPPLLHGGKRSVAIVTTASLPWMTGTAVNPLLRAAYLSQLGNQEVTLVVPWLTKEDQVAVYPNSITFDTPAQQEEYVMDWLRERVGFTPKFKIAFYPGKFSREKRSILAAGDIASLIPEEEADVAVLEEPEHLTWYYHGKRWTDRFSHVVGIIHTNYLEYVKREKNGEVQAALLEHVNNWMVRCYCNKVVRLSGATQNFPRSTVCNVHGVGVKFLSIGDAMARELEAGRTPFSKGAYYLGKMVWSKGYRELVDLLDANYEALGRKLRVDVFGSGEDSGAVRAEAQAKQLRMQFHKGRDHADPALHGFKVFINPSISDVVCTTTAEALAMGKIVVCADHPSNDFFRRFPNCLIYRTPQEFVEKVNLAMASEPKPLTAEQRRLLTWEAATERFLHSAGLEELAVPASSAAATSAVAATVSDPSLPPSMAEVYSPPGGALPGSEFKQAADEPVRRAQSWDNLVTLGAAAKRRPQHGMGGGAFTAATAPASLSMSLSSPDLNELLDRFLSFSHFMASGVEPARDVAGAMPGTMHIDEQLSKELGLPPPWVQRPTYGW